MNYSDFTCTAVAKYFSDTGAESKIVVMVGKNATEPQVDFHYRTWSINVDEFQMGTSTIRAFIYDLPFTSSHNQQLHMITGNGGYVDGSSVGSFSTAGENTTFTPFFAGVTSYDYNKDRETHARTQGVIIWTADQVAAGNRTGIEDNTMTHFSIT